MKKYLVTFSEISKRDVPLVGGKAASLGELTNAKFPVPPGFVLTTECYKQFWNQEFPVDVKNQIFKQFDMLCRERVAVRSSAISEDSKDSSWAGQLDTFLNVKKEDLIDTIRNCWESIHSERALAYIAQNNVDEKELTVGVVVQKMVDSEVSGVMFTVNPVTGNTDEVMLEAGYGLGELLVQGFITPDNFLVHKKTLKILESNISSQDTMLLFRDGKNKKVSVPKELRDKPSLTPEQIKRIAKIGIKIEKHYSSPQDIEWANEKNEIFIVQSRPVTTLINN